MTQRKQSTNSAIGMRVISRAGDRKGSIVLVEHHKQEPWTRYVVEFDDGSEEPGLIIGKDIKIA